MIAQLQKFKIEQKGLTFEEHGVILILFKNEPMEVLSMQVNASIVNYFDIMGKAQKSYGRQMEPVCQKWKLTRNELDVLLFLYNNPEFDRAADIVSRRGIAKSHVSLSVTGLEKRGLLTRCFEPADRRTAHLKLTEQGEAIAREGKKVQQSFFAALYGGVTEEEFKLWRKITQKVCGNIENIDNSLTNL